MATSDVASKIPTVRAKFLDKYNGSILDDTYDERDVDWLKTDDRFVGAVIRAYKTGGDVTKCVDLLNDILLFRAKMKLNDLKESDLNAELLEKNGCYYHGTDKQGHKILHFRVCKSKKGHLVKEGKQYLAYHMNQHYRQHPDQQLVFFFDFVDAGVNNMDMDITKFIIHCASTNFPSIASYNLMFKMAPALEIIWKIIKGFLDKDQSKNTTFITRKNIGEYVEEKHLLPHMIKESK